LYFFLLAVSGFFAVLIAGLVIVFAVKYRRRSDAERPRPIAGSIGLEMVWTSIPFGLAMVMFVWGASVFFAIRRPPDDAEEVFVVAKQWMWKVQHLGGQREINELHVPAGRPVRLRLISEDVIHDFFVPAFRVKVDVLPGRYATLWFEATKPGTYHFFCAQYCGTNHSRMVGHVIVMEPARFQAWLNSRAEGSPALEGRKLFMKFRCVACHSASARARAPVLEELLGQQVPLRDGGTVTADKSYLRESILTPKAKVVAGFEPIMPTFQGQISEEELLRIIAFIKSLQRGQTPVRTEDAEPPSVEASPGASEQP
jgi:cytochrome c oxidase subunit 2